jgi:fumarylacetoacetase
VNRELSHLPYGVVVIDGRRTPAVRVGDHALDLAAAEVAGLLDAGGTLRAGSLNPFLAAGPVVWRSVRERLPELVADGVAPLHPLDRVTPVLPFEVGDYVDFYSSEHHAANAGRIFRPGQPPLLPNWKHLPVGYHGRAGTVVVSGTPVVRPCGQRRTDNGPDFGPSARLDIEAEVGFVIGAPSGTPITVDRFADHVFGVVLVNDWSARDLQAWEAQPLGPFLSKSFATSVGAWITPLAALDAAWVPLPPQDPPVLDYLREPVRRGLDLALTVRWNGTVVSRPPFAAMYWTPAQQLAHLTVAGASVRTGDLFASGTVSGPARDQVGSFLELSWGGAEPVRLADGVERTFLRDGDTVTIEATAPGTDGSPITFGEVTGTVQPARG